MLDKYNDIISVKELCDILQTGKNTAYNLLRAGHIHSIKIGSTYKIPKKYLIDYILSA